jgi:hypothetical protein
MVACFCEMPFPIADLGHDTPGLCLSDDKDRLRCLSVPRTAGPFTGYPPPVVSGLS